MNNAPRSPNWDIVSLEEVASFQNGHAFYKDGYSDHGLLAFDLMNVSEEGKLRFGSRDKFVSPDLCDKYSRFILNKGDLVIVMTDMTQRLGILGKCAVIDRNHAYILNQRMGSVQTGQMS
jgi:type I restriction enzyme S subunit